MLSLEQAIENLLNTLPFPSKTETLSLANCAHRVCAEDIYSPLNVPSFNNSAMDGYAIRFDDLQTYSNFTVIGKSFAGQPFMGSYQAGTAVRIMTGALLPEGYDTVIMQENATVSQDNVYFTTLPQRAGENVRFIGEDIKQGDLVLAQGTKLTSVSLPLLASLGIQQVTVYPKLKVAILATGDELVPVGQPLKTGQIYDTNSFTLKLMLQQWHCDILDYGIIADDEQLFEQTFLQAQQEADLVISSGGVSVGEADFTKEVLERIGEMSFWKIAMKPGKPFAFGKLEKAWFCGLPGNPVSAFVTFYQLVQPVLARLSGMTQFKRPQALQAKAKYPLKKAVGRTDFQRGFYQVNAQGDIEVEAIGMQGSHLFSSFVKSNCFIVLERERGNVQAGETVWIEPFNFLVE